MLVASGGALGARHSSSSARNGALSWQWRDVHGITSGVVVGSASGSTDVYRIAADAWDPKWSPDGNEILYAVPGNQSGTGLYVQKIPGTLHTLVAGETVEGAAWSPDGSQIAFVVRPDQANEAQLGQLYVASPDGSGAKEIYAGTMGEISWAMTPGGSMIAVDGAFENETHGIAFVEPDGTRPTPDGIWTPDGAMNQFGGAGVSWNPTGNGDLIFGTEVPDAPDCATYQNQDCGQTDLDLWHWGGGTSITDLTNTGSWAANHESNPAWSPDGSQIAYVAGSYSWDGSNVVVHSERVWLMNPDGSNQHPLATGEPSTGETGTLGYDRMPNWQPCTTSTVTCEAAQMGGVALHTLIGGEVTPPTGNGGAGSGGNGGSAGGSGGGDGSGAGAGSGTGGGPGGSGGRGGNGSNGSAAPCVKQLAVVISANGFFEPPAPQGCWSGVVRTKDLKVGPHSVGQNCNGSRDREWWAWNEVDVSTQASWLVRCRQKVGAPNGILYYAEKPGPAWRTSFQWDARTPVTYKVLELYHKQLATGFYATTAADIRGWSPYRNGYVGMVDIGRGSKAQAAAYVEAVCEATPQSVGAIGLYEGSKEPNRYATAADFAPIARALNTCMQAR